MTDSNDKEARDENLDENLRQAFRPRSNSDLTEVGLIRRATPLVDAFGGRLPLPRELADINEHFGVEIAQTVFAQAVERSPLYSRLMRRVRGFDPRSLASIQDLAKPFEVTLVRSSLPVRGLEWGEFATKWQTWARSLGFTTDIIETLEDNDIRANAKVISTYLFSNPHPRRILVTYGQGAAEFRSLLNTRLGRRVSGEAVGSVGELGTIHTWINVAGAFGGAGIARMTNESWLASFQTKIARSFGASGRRARAQRWLELDSRLPAWRAVPNFPSHLQVVNVIGQPLRSEVPLNLLVAYDHLARETGPNDGAVGVFEAIAHPGAIVLVPGMSHVVEPVKFEPIFKRLLALIATDAAVEQTTASTEPGEPAISELDL